jgi:hypothetical protein
MKHCGGCDTWKDESEFNWKNKILHTRQRHCKKCQSDWTKRHYQKNKEAYLQRAKIRNSEVTKANQAIIVEYLREHPCIDCGETDIVVLDFDHQSSKKFNIGSELHWKNSEELIAEIAKCQVRCANCHRRKTARDRKYYRLGD